MSKDHDDTYYSKGQLFAFLCSGSLSSVGIVGIANHVFRNARHVTITGSDAKQMLEIARDLETAAATYRQAAALAFPAPALMAAE